MKRGNHGSASQRQTFITVSGNLNFSPVLITEWVGSFASPREKFLLCNGETCKDFLPIPYSVFSTPLLHPVVPQRPMNTFRPSQVMRYSKRR